MLDLLLSKLLELLINLGYSGLFLASLGLFVPIEVVIAILAAQGENIWIISLISATGALLGGVMVYLLGFVFTIRDPETWLGGRVKFLKIDVKEIEKSRERIAKHSFFYIYITRFVPWLRVAASIAAGFFRINIFSYCISIFLGAFSYSISIAYFGSKVGDNIDRLQKYINVFDKWLILIVLAYLIISIGYKKRKMISRLVKSILKR